MRLRLNEGSCCSLRHRLAWFANSALMPAFLKFSLGRSALCMLPILDNPLQEKNLPRNPIGGLVIEALAAQNELNTGRKLLSTSLAEDIIIEKTVYSLIVRKILALANDLFDGRLRPLSTVLVSP